MNINVNRTRALLPKSSLPAALPILERIWEEICLLSLFALIPAVLEATRGLVADYIIALAPSVAVTRECVG
jgi:hypothetical protein